MKPPLVFLYVSLDDQATCWPELGKIHEVDAEEHMKTYESHGMAVAIVHGPCVASIPEGSEHSLRILENEMSKEDVLCISVRSSVPGSHRSWWGRLEDAAKERGIIVVDHNRHDVLEAVSYRLFSEGLRAIEDSADLLRSPGIDQSTEAMKTETALTRAIQALRATGFRAPRRR